MAKQELHCWKCGASLVDILLPLSRLAKCRACHADLQVCRMCKYYDTGLSNSCREPVAELVNDKKRANFCGYFQPSEKIPGNGNSQAQSSQASLESLFGLEQNNSKQSGDDVNTSSQELDALFGLDGKKQDQNE